MTQSQTPSPPQAASAAPPPKSRLPLVALLLSLFGLCTCGLGAIAGLVCGIVALKTGKGSSGLATAAIIVGALVIGFWFVMVPMLGLPIFLKNEINEWVRDIWEQVKEDTAQEKDDSFGDRPRDTAPLPWPAPAQPG